MSWRTNSVVILTRSICRSLGINKYVAKFILGEEYEHNYDRGFSKCIQLGDCIWDIGANIGHYTASFSHRVGNTGKVIAFEPSPMNFARLSEKCSSLSNVSLHQVGIGATDSMMKFIQGGDSLGATSRFVDEKGDGESISIRSAESLLEHASVPRPNVVKIDVEGFELDVLNGFGRLLENNDLRAIGVEMHFGILQERGQTDAPARIEKLLTHSGFKIRWADPSHILAVRTKTVK